MIKKPCCSRFLLHKFVQLKYFWTLFKNVHLQGPCSLRPCISRPYCNESRRPVLVNMIESFLYEPSVTLLKRGKYGILMSLHGGIMHCTKTISLISPQCQTSCLETVQYFLIKSDIKPPMHLLEIIIFSLNNDLARLTKIMNNPVKNLKILIFKVIFQCLELVESFEKNLL